LLPFTQCFQIITDTQSTGPRQETGELHKPYVVAYRVDITL